MFTEGGMAAIAGGKGHLSGKSTPDCNYYIHISNAEQCNCLGFGTRINVATGTTHEPNGSLPPHNRSFVTDITAHLEYHHHRIQMFLDLSIKMKLTKECWVAVQGLGRKTPVTLLVPIFSVLTLLSLQHFFSVWLSTLVAFSAWPAWCSHGNQQTTCQPTIKGNKYKILPPACNKPRICTSAP